MRRQRRNTPAAALDIFTEVLGVIAEVRKRAYGPNAIIGHICAVLGGRDQALEKARRERSPLLAYLKVARCYDNLRADARFPSLLKSVELSVPLNTSGY